MSDEMNNDKPEVSEELESQIEDVQVAEVEPGISPIRIEDEMENSFIDYSMSVIVGRALPDARDGMKPVHRRCIYSMGETGTVHSKPHRKSARVVGDVMGKYHPHGDSAIYETIVRMAQPFSMRYKLVDGHGNFGSIDGDGAAAARYTEVRMERFAEDMLEDLEKDTVDMVPNYDGEEVEPTVLPAKLPNLLLNGSMGIAVGMATNIPTHNLNELCDAIVAMVDNPQITIDELMQYVKGPDFPTGGIIRGIGPIRDMYRTGRGSICVRGKAEITPDGRQIVITEIPYGVNKSEMLARMGDLVDNSDIREFSGISDIRDISKGDQDIRVEIDLKKDAVAEVILNLLYKYTQLQSNFAANMLALDHGRPKVMNLKQFFRCFIDHRIEVITRRTRYLLKKAMERSHILEGFRIAIDNIDEVVQIIRSSKDDSEVKIRFRDRFGLDEEQTQAILEMRLRQLTGLQREKVEEEYNQLQRDIAHYNDILSTPQMVLDIIKGDCEEIKGKYGDERKTVIEFDSGDIDWRELIPNEPCVITITDGGYVKRCALDLYAAQARGGKGHQGVGLKVDDLVKLVITCKAHDNLLFFTSHGRVFTELAWRLPEGGRTNVGKHIKNFIQLRERVVEEGSGNANEAPKVLVPEETVVGIISVGEGEAKDEIFDESKSIFFATYNGVIKKTYLSLFRNINKNGIKAINIDEGDTLIGAELVESKNEVMLVTANGQAVHFNEDELRSLSRDARGVKGINLRDGDNVVSLVKVGAEEDAKLLLIVENGYGVLTRFDAYPIHHRGSSGVRSIVADERNGKVVFAGTVHVGNGSDNPSDTIIAMTASGKTIRTKVSEIRECNRGAKGVRVVNLRDGDSVKVVEVAQGEAAEDIPAEAAASGGAEPQESADNE